MKKSFKKIVVLILFLGLLFSVISAVAFSATLSETLPKEYQTYKIPYGFTELKIRGVQILGEPIASNDENVFLVGKDIETKTTQIICVKSEFLKMKKVWQTSIDNLEVASLSVFDTYLFCLINNGKLLVLDNRDGEIVKTIDILETLELDNSDNEYIALLTKPVVVGSKILCRYFISSEKDGPSSGLACFAMGDFSVFYKKEMTKFDKNVYLPSINGLVSDGDFAYGIFYDVEDEKQRIYRIDPFGNPMELVFDDSFEDPKYDRESLSYFDGFIYVVINDFADEYIASLNLETNEANMLDITVHLLFNYEMFVSDEYIVISSDFGLNFFKRISLSEEFVIRNSNLKLSTRFFMDNKTLYTLATDSTDTSIMYLTKVDLTRKKLIWVNKGNMFKTSAIFHVNSRGFYTTSEAFGEPGERRYTPTPIVRYSYTDFMNAYEFEDILDGEVTDKCSHEMKLQIGNRYWATNGYMIEKPLDTAPMIRHDRTFIEIRSVTEKVGAEISWIAAERAVVIKGLKGEDIKLKIGSPIAMVNGEEVQIDDAGIIPFIENGRTMLPLRFVSESLGLVVGWNAENKVITLLYENPDCIQ